MIIWGWRRYVQTLAMVTFVCGQCGNPAAHALRRFVTKFTLFFVPLFPVARRFEVQCTFCGATGKVTREQAEAMQAQPQQPAAQQHPGPYPAQRQYPLPPAAGQPPHPAGNPAQSGYQAQPGYPAQSDYPAQAGYPAQSGYPAQPGQPG